MNNCRFTFYYFEGSVQLKVWGQSMLLHDKDYPQTFTVKECLEDYCDIMGIRFVSHYATHTENIGVSGTFDFVDRGGR